ncbi:universal stress protein [Leucobacter rhizosphaerae]|uniref:Universal stress protein n=1 Tax=Leucobacter rhizosphaerae TaxID=2932245 RepID=A0ABY4FY22_9MICO|nr:universal stress protein [Leucobacter rhizosphaerae]UOQ61189.1 universal stress protein [Leucobacter rhizosphaerae]
MTIVVGVAPNHRSEAAIQLGVLLARSYDRELVVASINSVAWPPSDSRVDTEYQTFLIANARAALDEAVAAVPSDIRVRTVVRGASSARRGLLEVCAEEDAFRLVVGSAGELGEGIGLGSVSFGLLQASEIPVAIAPHGFAVAAGAGAAGAGGAGGAEPARLTRVTAAYSGSDTSAELVLGGAAVAADAGAGIRIASFHTRPRSYAAAGVGLQAEDQVIAEWEATIRSHTREILSEIEQSGRAPKSVEVVVGAGSNWHEALRAIEWQPTEVLLLGSSSLGPLARISLGSHAAKILRASPVPVVLVPRRATDDYIARG